MRYAAQQSPLLRTNAFRSAIWNAFARRTGNKRLGSGLRPALSNGALEPAQRIEAVQPAVLLLHVIKCIRKANQ